LSPEFRPGIFIIPFSPIFPSIAQEPVREAIMALGNTDRTELNTALDQFQEYLTDIMELYRRTIPCFGKSSTIFLKTRSNS
jgi:hypothetical protein